MAITSETQSFIMRNRAKAAEAQSRYAAAEADLYDIYQDLQQYLSDNGLIINDGIVQEVNHNEFFDDEFTENV
ncbi:hypothetical protein ACED16_02510 [Enterobacter hormaechei]